MFICPDYKAWGVKNLYDLMVKSDYFEPIIAISPYNHQSKNVAEDITKKINDNLKYFKSLNYNCVVLNNNSYLSEMEKISPDIVFFNSTLFLDSIIDIFNCAKKTCLTAYVSYGYFLTNLQDGQFNTPIHNLLDYIFWETPMTLEMSKKYAFNKGVNGYFLGYTKIDDLNDKNYIPKDVWKKQATPKKRIIWAPHHSIENDKEHFGFSMFMELHEFMFELAEKYKDKIQIAFKPHPLLKGRLATQVWDKEKTEEYYNKWQEIENCQLEDGVYTDLFLTSDAMIMDSVSFMCEYTAMNKPCLFTVRDESVNHKFNELGTLIFDKCLYKSGADYKNDIIRFVEDVVLNGDDYIKVERTKIINKQLSLCNNEFSYKNIYNFLLNKVEK
ncbi:MAG: CDP-glycerol glycerophosphotransferase family protein [Candidatus Gastranaerophilaceae bacterium]